ncbi:hypothetical protein PHLGIDRAFT_35877 [Phlebiopsis gigantea 11061_1 CR5-6]|uniref:Uncharacterized protein n=1 Tax=Phlebiopsis gigantea (strain 11061_1 CR5-6) TaxID=745531 RepID=A0A0C3NNE8_PHLG1|nr:hypothetical protein PHLGIDRAFT_35877 [Phlebiopsis gigantea 11061_1 CR5-6]
MVKELSLGQLLAKPLGKPAYWEADILSPDCKSTPTKQIELENFTLVCNRRITGLTYIEPTQPEYQKTHVKSSDVFYRGIITIKHMKWLTEDAKRVLEKELQERDVRVRRKRLGRNVEPSNLRLSFALSTKTDFKVWIQGIKSFPAVFMIANQRITEGLYIQTKELREINVVSLSPETATRSQLYFARYRFRRELENIIKLNIPAPGVEASAAIPLAHRTVDWFISQYIRHILSGDATDTVKANLRNFFAAHCEWIIKDQAGVLHKHRRLIDVDTWKRWYMQWKNGTLPDSDDSMSVDEHAEAEVGEGDGNGDIDMDDVPPPSIRRGIKRVVMNKASLPQLPLPEPETDDDASSGLEYIDAYDPVQAQAALEPRYYRHPTLQKDDSVLLDSDFESPSEHGSDAESEDSFVVPSIRTDPDVLEAIPAAIGKQPRLPSPGDSWYCPIEGCCHEIDMYRLPADEKILAIISEDERAWVTSCNWSWNDPDLIAIFMDLVSGHYASHLRDLGIEAVGQGPQMYFRWRHPEEHPSEHAKSRREVDNIAQLAENLHME